MSISSTSHASHPALVTGQAAPLSPRLIIFDLDGTLVDSELLCNQAFLDLLPTLNTSAAALLELYRGLKLSHIFADLERQLGQPLPTGFEVAYRRRVAELFVTDLKAFDGVPEMLQTLQSQGAPFCIASSGPPEKIRHALAVTGLAGFFGEHLFSAHVVKSWKPDPGLFLHAARAMGFLPAHCVVVEDSQVGLDAAAAAGMRALHFAPAGVDGKSGDGDNRFSSMAELTVILQNRDV